MTTNDTKANLRAIAGYRTRSHDNNERHAPVHLGHFVRLPSQYVGAQQAATAASAFNMGSRRHSRRCRKKRQR